VKKTKRIEIIKYTLKNNKKQKNKIISISGVGRSGKSTIANFIAYYLSKKMNKIAIINFGNSNIFFQNKLNQKKQKEEILNNLKKYKIRNIIKIKKENKKYEKSKKNRNKINKLLKNKENKIEKLKEIKSKKIFNIFYNKINNNIFIFSNLDLILKENKINELFRYLNKNFDFIIIDMNHYTKKGIERNILIKSKYNIIVVEQNLESLKRTERLLNKYLREYKIYSNKLKIIINKNSRFKFNSKIISSILYNIKIIGSISHIKYINQRIKNNEKINRIIKQNKINKIIK